ncbi:MAG: hypothetical protein JSS02_06125 [Planctomycetes bacterium]|nr:hypothetical protein [Planctomycetota bacterium]
MNCIVNHVRCNNIIVEDVVVDGLTVRLDPFFINGTVFKQVTLKGKIGTLCLRGKPLPGLAAGTGFETDEVAPLLAANAEYYKHVDWALDISEGLFSAIDIEGIPVHLIRRDPATQFVITRRRATEIDWLNFEFQGDYAPGVLDIFLKDRPEDSAVVIVAGKRSRTFRETLADLQMLREKGVAEPD